MVPDSREFLFAEDRIVEWTTVFAYFAAALAGFRLFATKARGDIVLLVVSAFAAIAVMEEISFGERILGFEAPRIGNTKMDALHDLLIVAKRGVKGISEHPYLVAAGVALMVAGLVIWICRALVRRGWTVRFGGEAVLLSLAVVLLAYAQAIDTNLRIVPHRLLKPLYIEEILELGAGLCLVFFVVLRDPRRRTATSAIPDRAGYRSEPRL